jgi:hypothetical protein
MDVPDRPAVATAAFDEQAVCAILQCLWLLDVSSFANRKKYFKDFARRQKSAVGKVEQSAAAELALGEAVTAIQLGNCDLVRCCLCTRVAFPIMVALSFTREVSATRLETAVLVQMRRQHRADQSRDEREDQDENQSRKNLGPRILTATDDVGKLGAVGGGGGDYGDEDDDEDEYAAPRRGERGDHSVISSDRTPQSIDGDEEERQEQKNAEDDVERKAFGGGAQAAELDALIDREDDHDDGDDDDQHGED